MSRELHEWYKTPWGKALKGIELKYLVEIISCFYGYYLLQLGCPGDREWLQNSKINHQFCIEPSGELPDLGQSVQGNYDQLPFESHSIDLVVLPHVLEFVEKPHAVLEEACRVLIPEGYIVLTCFNRFSLLGITKLLSISKRKQFPWTGQFYSVSMIRKHLHSLGCVVMEVESCYYRPAINNKKCLQQLKFLDKCYSFLRGKFGGTLIITAKKRVVGATPIRAIWKKEKVPVSSGIVEPTARGGHD